MGSKKIVEGNASYRLDADLDTIANAFSMAEHRLHVAASIYGGKAVDPEANTYTVGGVVLIRYRAKLVITDAAVPGVERPVEGRQ
jgi:hypothetical protein